MEPDDEQAQQHEQKQIAEPAEVKPEQVEAEIGVAPQGESAAREVGDDELREKLLQMLQESDLSTVTEKMLRKQLEGQLGVKLADKKQLIRQEVMAFLAKQQVQDGEQDAEGEEAKQQEGSEGEEEEEQEEKPRKRRSNSQLGSVLSEPMQAFVGAESMPRTQVVKAIWDYIKANNLQDPKDKRSIIPDEKLATILTPPVTMFSMNKQISRHVFSRDAIMGGGSDEDSEQQPANKAHKSGGSGDASSSRPKPRLKPRAQAKGSSEGGDGAKKELKGFARPQRISDELAAVTGQPEMSRGTLMKWLFAYIKENDLYDPSNRRYVISDNALQQLTGESRFLAFGAQKLFGKHFVK